MSGIKDKVILITGASSGIGEATARMLAGKGARVILGARRTDRLESIAKEIGASGGRADFRALDARHIKGMERTAGLKDLRFETEPVAGDREVQSVLNGNGRIIGWFSWEPENAMSDALGELRPLATLTAIFLVAFAGIAFWQIRRTVRDLGTSERLAWQLAHEDMLTGLPNHRKVWKMRLKTMIRLMVNAAWLAMKPTVVAA